MTIPFRQIGYLLLLLLVAAALHWFNAAPGPAEESTIDAAFRSGASDVMATTEGRVTRVLADDTEGSAHQRFIIEIPSGLTVLVAHNIDLAPRVPGLRPGDSVRVRGEYEWNDRGGVLHWTHRDPDGGRTVGWIEFEGRRYE